MNDQGFESPSSDIAELKDFFDNAPDMFVSACADTSVIRRCNDAVVQTLGISRDKIIGMPLKSLYHPDCHSRFESVFELFTSSGEACTDDLFAITADGQKMPVSLMASAVRDAEGRVLYSRSVLRDLTKYNQLRARIELVQHEESLAVLTGGIAHDFNNILVGILGNSELANSVLPQSSPAAKYIRDIETAASHAADLSRQLLAYSGNGNIEVSVFDLGELIQEMESLMSSSISKNINIEYPVSPSVVVEADATQVKQVAMNLISNAADSISDDGGSVQIRTGVIELSQQELDQIKTGELTRPGKFAYWEVSDCGCGMSSEMMSRMFDPFFTTKSGGHHGLGLAATSGIVRQHRGAIDVSSCIGEGTTVRILLPVADSRADPKSDSKKTCTAPMHPNPQVQKGGGAILAVDDNEMVLKVVCNSLENAGYSVIPCSSGEQAVEVFRQRASEIESVVLDLSMPGMDGIETFRQLRQLDEGVRVVFMSGHHEQAVFEEISQKSYSFIQKPFHSKDLIEKVRTATRSN